MPEETLTPDDPFFEIEPTEGSIMLIKAVSANDLDFLSMPHLSILIRIGLDAKHELQNTFFKIEKESRNSRVVDFDGTLYRTNEGLRLSIQNNRPDIEVDYKIGIQYE